MTAALKIKHPDSVSQERPLLRPDEVARTLGLDKVSSSPERVVRGMCRRGELRAVHVGKWLFIHPDSVDAYLGGPR